MSQIVHIVARSANAVTILGGGAARAEDIRTALSRAPMLVAADGGAVAALAAGHMPDWVIGDLDSLGAATRDRVPGERIVEVAEQESTDFEKCLTRIDAPLVLATGITGARTDHTLAALSVIARHHDRRVVAFDADDVIFAAPPELCLATPAGMRVSLFPFAGVTGRSEGLRWEIDGLDFAPAGRIGTSNIAEGRVRLSFDRPGMLVILPRAALDLALDALG